MQPFFGPFVTLVLLAGLAVAASPAARAQENDSFPIRIKLGVFQPNDRYTRKISGSTHFSGEIDVALPLFRSNAAQTLFSVGYSYRSGNGYGLGSSYQVAPLSLTLIRSLTNPEGRVRSGIYYGTGVGIYLVRATGVSLVGRTSPPNFSAGDRSRILLGTSLVAGYQAPAGFFIEGKYHLVNGSVQGYSPDGLSVFLGKRL